MANWKARLAKEVALLGHRNWIVVADAAYPAQCRSGIETIVTGEDHVKTLKAVLEAIDKAGHVKAGVYVDAELTNVPEQYAKGVTAYREKLTRLLAKRSATPLPHEQIIAMLDKAGEMFRVLILKTRMKLPYTSVFLQLDCGYWNAEAETVLRNAMQASA